MRMRKQSDILLSKEYTKCKAEQKPRNCGDALAMKIGRNKTSSNYLKITLNSMDTYDMKFSRVSPMGGERSITEYDNVYNDQLQEIFTSHTGMYTSL